MKTTYLRLVSSTILGALPLTVASTAWAQDRPANDAAYALASVSVESAALTTQASASEPAIVVTGSRIRRSAVDTTAPVLAIDSQFLTDRGFVTAADALNQVTSNVPDFNVSNIPGSSSGNGQQYPNLFGLGPARTLTLVNGRRFVTSANGLSGVSGAPSSVVDVNIIPTGLIERIEIVQAGGAVVYGSDAIAGVVNYILKDDFEGLELDAQAGISTYKDYPVYSLRGTAGRNFADGRGNIAINVEWSRSNPLQNVDRPYTADGSYYVGNPSDTGPSDGRPSVVEILDARFYSFNTNGVIFSIPAPVPLPPCGNDICFARNAAGQALQFGPDGSIVPFDVGKFDSIPFSVGGDGYPLRDLGDLRSGLERLSANLLGHLDLGDNLRISTELLYARSEATQRFQLPAKTPLGSDAAGNGAIIFFRTNPFLTPAAIAALSTANPGFAVGAPLFLGRMFDDVLTDNRNFTTTETYRGLLALDGSFDAGSRNFYYSLSGSYSRVEGESSGYALWNGRYANAINAVKNSAGAIVCAINADAVTANDDPACSPINPFGPRSVSQAARDYVSVRTGARYVNKQADLLATIGGEIVSLPAGEVRFSAAYEHRDEHTTFTPFLADQLGLTGSGEQVEPDARGYNTDEVSAEILVPILGQDFTLPFAKAVELSGAFRHVDNSVAGSENLWSLGLRWQVMDGLTLRGSRSRNFRAPQLAQLFTPQTVELRTLGPGADPCDKDSIDSGPNPSVRRANCLALFQANPGYGVLPGGANTGASAEARLATFQNPSDNLSVALVTSGGNPDLRNELSDTLTFGIVLQPKFLPGLTFTADRVEVDLTDGLSPFTTANFAAACFDNTDPPADVCDQFSRLATPSASNPGGTIVTGRTTTFNAGLVKYRGEVFNLNYVSNLSAIFGGREAGRLELGIEATHTSLLTTSVTGNTFERMDNTVAQPDWVARFDARYVNGPLRLTYQVVYSSPVKFAADATVETVPYPRVGDYFIHNVSGQHDFGPLSIRAGINNLFDNAPFASFGTLYGDLIGRQFYVGARVRF